MCSKHFSIYEHFWDLEQHESRVCPPVGRDRGDTRKVCLKWGFVRNYSDYFPLFTQEVPLRSEMSFARQNPHKHNTQMNDQTERQLFKQQKQRLPHYVLYDTAKIINGAGYRQRPCSLRDPTHLLSEAPERIQSWRTCEAVQTEWAGITLLAAADQGTFLCHHMGACTQHTGTQEVDRHPSRVQ